MNIYGRLYKVSLCVIFIGVVLMVALTPLLGDDLWYMMTSSGATNKAEEFRLVWGEVVRHWHFDTGRLANIINPPFLVFVPKWVFGIVTGLLTVLIVELSRRFAGVSQGSVLSWWIVGVAVFILPWLDYMFTVVYALNYVWAAAFSLMALYLVTGHLPSGKWGYAAGVVCCIVAGWMHEGFSVPMLAGVVLYFIVKRGITKRQLWLVLWWMAGAMLIFVAPAFWNRTAGSYSILIRFTGWESLLSATLFNCLTFLYSLVFVISAANGRLRRRISASGGWAFAWLCLVVCAIGSALFYMYYNGSRMGFIMQLFGGIGTAYLVKYWFAERGAFVRNVAGVAMVAVICLHYVVCVVEQFSLYKEFYEIANVYRSEPSGRIFYDHIKPKVGVSLLRPSYRAFNEHFPLEEFSYYYGPDRPNLVIVPKVLEQIDMSDALTADGTPLFIYKGYILMRDSDVKVSKVRIKTEAGGEIVTRVRQDDFETCDGERYSLIVPHLQYSPLKFKYKEIWMEEFDRK